MQAAHRAREKGYLEKRGDLWEIIEHGATVAFIPNSFVRTETGVSPLGRLVNNGELGPILLAAELYHLQDLMDERGVPSDIIRGYFYPWDVRKFGNHALHYLTPGRIYENAKSGKSESFPQAYHHHWNHPDGFWGHLQALDAAHVVEWAVYSANGRPSREDKYAFHRPQRPLGVLRNGRQVFDTPESRPAFAAYLADLILSGRTDLLDGSLEEVLEEWRAASPVIAIENKSVSHVEGVSILRMVHRANTQRTKVWYRDLSQECERAFFFAEAAIRELMPQASGILDEVRTIPQLGEAISKKINEWLNVRSTSDQT